MENGGAKVDPNLARVGAVVDTLSQNVGDLTYSAF
jgi:hypothetical protein